MTDGNGRAARSHRAACPDGAWAARRGTSWAAARLGVVAACACAAAALGACGGGPLAEAAGRRLSVEDAARLIAEHSTLPPDTQVARAVAELWVDYTLLSAHLEADTSLASLDVAALVRQPLEDEMLARLQAEVIDADTVVTDEELAARFAAETPGARATASQILLLFPPEATARQRDSVLAMARAVRLQLDAGADFGELAAQVSDDPGSARRGGGLGVFERGRMLAPVDQAVFAMQPGETSEPVASSLGYHVLRLDALDIPELPEVAAEFRAAIRQERLAEAEAAYIAQLDSLAGLRLAEGALAVVRALAQTPAPRLSTRAARRPLMEWEGGRYTAGDFLALARESPPGFAEGVHSADDSELEEALLRLGRQRLLVEEARARGFEPTQARRDSVSAQARSAIRQGARAIGLGPEGGPGGAGTPGDAGTGADASGAGPDAEAVAGAGAEGAEANPETVAGESPDALGSDAPDAAPDPVRAVLAAILAGQREINPLGAVSLLLRDQSPWRIRASRIGATAQRALELQP